MTWGVLFQVVVEGLVEKKGSQYGQSCNLASTY